MLPLHHSHHGSGDGRTRTGGFSPDKRVLLPLSYAPVDGAGGIRTHGLELMRLARTAAPPPRVARVPQQVWPAGVEPAISGTRSRRGGHAPPRPDEQSTPGGTRTRSFRVEGPASSPVRPRGHKSSGGRTRTCASRLTVARLSVSTTPERAEGEGVEPPRPGSPPVFETGYRTHGSPSAMASAGVEPAPHPLRVGGSTSLSYEAERRDRQGSNLRRLAFQTSALPLSYGHEKK
jgi:hypothetical protein